jgi:hypothetical protein
MVPLAAQPPSNKETNEGASNDMTGRTRANGVSPGCVPRQLTMA